MSFKRLDLIAVLHFVSLERDRLREWRRDDGRKNKVRT